MRWFSLRPIAAVRNPGLRHRAVRRYASQGDSLSIGGRVFLGLWVQTGFRTAAIGRRESRRLWRGRARHPRVSASGTPRHSPKTPRNGGKFAAGSRSGHGFSGVADYLAVGAVWCEPVSGSEIPDLLGKYREIFRNQTLPTALGPKFPNLDAVVATDSLRSGRGN